MTISISIAIPAFNGERYIEQTIDSVLNQTRKPDEFIVFIDNSTDKTKAIVEKYKKYNIKIFHNKFPTGFVDAWSRCIKACSSDYIAILHQDDLLEPDFLFHVEKGLQKYPEIGHLYCKCDYIDEHGKHYKGTAEPGHFNNKALFKIIDGLTYAENYLYNRPHRCPGVVTKRDLFSLCPYRKVGLIADDDFFLRIGKYTKVVEIDAQLASFRHHPYSTTHKYESLSYTIATDWYNIYNEFKKDPFFSDTIFRYIYKTINKMILRYYAESIIENNPIKEQIFFQFARKVKIRHANKFQLLRLVYTFRNINILKNFIPLWFYRKGLGLKLFAFKIK